MTFQSAYGGPAVKHIETALVVLHPHGAKRHAKPKR